MKRVIQNIIMLSAVIIFGSCNPNKVESKREVGSQTQTSAVQKNVKTTKKIATETKAISGKIKSIVKDKDGYIAELLTDGDEDTYYITVNPANLITAQ